MLALSWAFETLKPTPTTRPQLWIPSKSAIPCWPSIQIYEPIRVLLIQTTTNSTAGIIGIIVGQVPWRAFQLLFYSFRSFRLVDKPIEGFIKNKHGLLSSPSRTHISVISFPQLTIVWPLICSHFWQKYLSLHIFYYKADMFLKGTEPGC